MEDSENNSSEQLNAVGSSNRDLHASASEIHNIVTERVSQYPNSVLACQIQKALPDAAIVKSRSSLHAALQSVSQESLLKQPDLKKDKQVVFQLPRKSIHAPTVSVEEYTIGGSKDKLLTDDFVRNLPVTMNDKRYYRQSIVTCLTKKSWYIEVYDFALRHWENFQSWFDIWNEPLKDIEGKHGAAIVAYFIFIRWLLFLNAVIFLLYLFFLVIPQMLCPREDITESNMTYGFPSDLSEMSDESDKQKFLQDYPLDSDEYELNSSLISQNLIYISRENLTNYTIDEIVYQCQKLYRLKVINRTRYGIVPSIQNVLQGTGYLESTYLFLGYYMESCNTIFGNTYYISLASLFVILVTFIFCLIMMITYTSVGIQEAFLVRSKRSSYYSNEVFSAWDYSINNAKSAEERRNRFAFEMKTSLSDDRDKRDICARSGFDWAVLYLIRIFINVFILFWLYACFYLIYGVVLFQMKELRKHNLNEPGFHTLFIQFLPTITVIILNSVSPIVFSTLIIFEKYAPEMQSNITMFRNIFLSLASFFVLLNTFYLEIACDEKDICGFGETPDCTSPRCWETYVGQQLYRFFMIDFFVYLGIFFCHDCVQNYVTQKYDNKFTKLWGYPTFNLSAEVLAPVFSQSIVWFGVFFSPLLPGLMVVKLLIVFHLKKKKILEFCPPVEHSYHASRFNAKFILLLLISFFTALVVSSFAVDRIPPSRGCGPFRRYSAMKDAIPDSIKYFMKALMSYWTISLTTIILCLMIHYYWRVQASQKELAKRLKAELVVQSIDKQYLLRAIAQLTERES